MTDKENLERKNKKVTLIMGIASLLVIIGVGYAFFSGGLSNSVRERFSSETATIALKFDDNDNGISGTLNLGESITKKFTLENTGTKDAYAKINWVDLVNTYLSGSLSYTLEQSTSENGIYEKLDSGNVATSNVATTATLKNGILVPVNGKYYYKLTIKLNNLEDVNQNSDINANFHSFFSLEEGNLSGVDKIQNLVSGANTNSTAVITKEAPAGSTCTNTLAYDGTNDNNLRYVGANPCNYVSFNGEALTPVEKWIMIITSTGQESDNVFDTQEACQAQYDEWRGQGMPENYYTCQSKTLTTGGWRIIGVMNNVDDGTGKKETRIKLVRNDALGNYSWDSLASGVHAGYGVNDWTQADLKNELNGDYLDTTLTSNTMWYNGQNNQKTAEYDYTKGLKASAQAQIGDAKWYLGGMKYENNDLIPSTMYTKERGTEVWGSSSGQTCNDGACPRATSWTGKVALIYPSDYGYGTAGGEVTNRSSCINTLSLYYNTSGETWNNSANSNCKDNNWIPYQWALSPTSNYSDDAFYVTIGGIVDDRLTNFDDPARPAVYLKSSVSISEGEGTESEPYVLK